jgi:hypothetical protein
MSTFERFEHTGYAIWGGEFFGHDVTIAREHGTSEFEVWIDAVLVSRCQSFVEAERTALKRTAQ